MRRQMPTWALIAAGAVIVAYAAFVVWLLLAGRRGDARALAGFLPDCAVLLRRVLRDARTPRRTRVVLVLAIGYLLMPIDLVPDFLPVIGVLDDAIVVALTLRWIVRTAGAVRVTRHWRGYPRGLELVLRAVYRPGG